MLDINNVQFLIINTEVREVLSLPWFEQESVKAAIFVVLKVENFALFCNCKRCDLLGFQYCHLLAISIANFTILWVSGFAKNKTSVKIIKCTLRIETLKNNNIYSIISSKVSHYEWRGKQKLRS